MASIQYVVNAVDAASGVFAKIAASADGLDKQLADLSKRVATPEVDLKDAKFTLGMINAAKRLDKLSAMVADPSVTVDEAKAQTEILRITAMLDRLDAKRVNVKVGVDRSLLSRLGGLAGGGGGAGAAGAGGALAIGATIGPLLVGLSQVAGALAAAGAGVAAFGALSIPQFSAVSGALSQIKTDTDAYERATTAAGKSLALKHIRQDWADLNGPQAAAVHGIQSLQAEFGKLSAKLAPVTFKVLNDGLKIANALLPSLLPFATAAGNAIDGLLKSFGKFTQSAGFKAFLAQLQALSGPAITALGQGLGQIAVAVGKLILASAQPNSIKVLSGLLTVMAGTIDVITFVIGRASGKIVEWKNDFGDIGRVVGGFLKNLANWQVNVALWVVNVTRDFRNWAHDVAHTFDTLRHNIATAWDLIWNNTVSTVRNGVNNVVTWFKGLPGRALSALAGLGHQLSQWGSSAVGQMFAGLKSAWNSVLGWFTGLPASILHALGIHSPPGWAIDAGKHIMSGILHGLNVGTGGIAGFFGGVAGKIGGFFGHLFGGGGGAGGGNRALAMKLFPWPASMFGAFDYVEMREAGYNLTARNPSSGAYGMAQFINGPGEYAQWGGNAATAAGQLIAMFNYIRSRYGNPLAAAAHERAFNWYGAGLSGGIFSRPTLIGVGERGAERVDITPAGSPDRSMARVESLLTQLITETRAAPARTGEALGGAFHGAARGARYSGMYSPR